MKAYCMFCNYEGDFTPIPDKVENLKEIESAMALATHMMNHKEQGFNLDSEFNECFAFSE